MSRRAWYQLILVVVPIIIKEAIRVFDDWWDDACGW
jgi:hypothetical protein